MCAQWELGAIPSEADMVLSGKTKKEVEYIWQY